MPKQDLVFRKPILNAAGSLGFSPNIDGSSVLDGFGAFLTNHISLRPRMPAEEATVIAYPGGILIHSGLPNPGFRRALQHYAHAWARAPLPIVVSLMADRPDETREMVRALEGLENILAVELGFAPLLADDLILITVEMSAGELPIIVSLQAEQVLRLGSRAEAMGAAAISLSPPRGSLWQRDHMVSGRLFGPALFPASLEILRAGCKLGLHMIASGGVTSRAQVEAMLAAGAFAIEVDTGLWTPGSNEKGPVS